jgi:hypothetical protein
MVQTLTLLIVPPWSRLTIRGEAVWPVRLFLCCSDRFYALSSFLLFPKSFFVFPVDFVDYLGYNNFYIHLFIH